VHIPDPKNQANPQRIPALQLPSLVNVRRKTALAGYACAIQAGTTGEGNLHHATFE